MATERTCPPASAQRVLVVEDVPDTRESCRQLLELALRLEVDTAADGAQALAMLAERPYSLVLTDLRMPRVGGLGLLREMRANRLPCTVIVTTGLGSVKEAVEAMRLGAYDYLEKPLDPQRLVGLVERALRERAARDELAALRHRLRGGHGFPNLLAKSPKMLDVLDQIVNAADATSPVLIQGEPGTGKEEVARAIHRASAARRPGPFVAVECDAHPDGLLEAALFGHEKGGGFVSPTTVVKPGAFERARGGTLFLAGVEHVPLALQPQLARVLQERHVVRVGGTDEVAVDARVIASTARNPEELVREGKLREDLFYRLGVLRVELPPLRNRPEDVPLLALHFAEKFARPDRGPAEVSPAAMELLVRHDWPGNVRQLENAMERACALTPDGVIRPDHLPGVTTTRP